MKIKVLCWTAYFRLFTNHSYFHASGNSVFDRSNFSINYNIFKLTLYKISRKWFFLCSIEKLIFFKLPVTNVINYHSYSFTGRIHYGNQLIVNSNLFENEKFWSLLSLVEFYKLCLTSDLPICSTAPLLLCYRGPPYLHSIRHLFYKKYISCKVFSSKSK